MSCLGYNKTVGDIFNFIGFFNCSFFFKKKIIYSQFSINQSFRFLYIFLFLVDLILEHKFFNRTRKLSLKWHSSFRLIIIYHKETYITCLFGLCTSSIFLIDLCIYTIFSIVISYFLIHFFLVKLIVIFNKNSRYLQTV